MSAPLFGYIEGRTVLHRIDPLSKLIWVMLATVLAFVLDDPRLIAIQLVAVLALCVLGTPRHAPLLVPVLLLLGLAVLLMIFQILNTSTGAVVAQWGPITVHQDGIDRGLVYTTRVATLTLTSFLFVRATDPRRLVVSLVHLRIPYRYAWMIFVALTSMTMFRGELETAREAQRVRGLNPAMGYLHQRMFLGRRYMQSLLVVGLRRVEIVSMAMDLRGFGSAPSRTFIDPFHWSAAGMALVATWVVLLTAATIGKLS